MRRNYLLGLCLILLCSFTLTKKLQAVTTAGTTLSNSATFYAIAGTYIVNSNLVTTLVAAMHGLDLNINPPQTILTSQTAYFAKTLTNLGNVTENISLTLNNTGEVYWTGQLIADDNKDGINQAGEITPVTLNQDLTNGEQLFFFVVLAPTTTNATQGNFDLIVTSSATSIGSYTGSNGLIYGGPASINISHIVFIDSGIAPVFADLEFDNMPIANGDYIGRVPLIQGRILDNDGILTASVTVNIDGAPADGILTFDGVNFTYQVVSSLPTGTHIFHFFAQDIFGNPGSKDLSVEITDKSMIVGKVLPYPNPFNPNDGDVKITYQLTNDAALNIYIHTITGERIWMTKIDKGQPGGHAGFNEVLWNGESGFNQALGNGVYLVHIINDKGKILAKTKILLIRK
jgi:hypothetical protein